MNKLTYPDVPVPDHLADLPRDPRGYPVPWVAAFQDGSNPAYRHLPRGSRILGVFDPKRHTECMFEPRCQVCGERFAQPIGEMTTFLINETQKRSPQILIEEPPMHRTCATYSAKVCPVMVLRSGLFLLTARHYVPHKVEVERRPSKSKHPGLKRPAQFSVVAEPVDYVMERLS